MQRTTIFKSVCLTGLALVLATGGLTPSIVATTTSAAAATLTEDPADTDKAPRLSAAELAEQKKDYGGVNDTLVQLTGTKNTRDLGGIQTADGKWQIRPNRLLRSDNLNGLTNADKQILTKTHHVTAVIDFRTVSQIDDKPDQPIPGATNTNISILGEKAYGKNPIYNDTFNNDGGFYIHQLEFGVPAVNGYRQFLNGLLANPRATLYHCSSGKDRTGIATVLIMSILGMNEKTTITNDFMQSNQTGRTVKIEWLTEYFKEIKDRYKTMDNYLTKMIQFTPLQREKLRAQYLVSTDGKNTPYPAPQEPAPAPTPSTPEPTDPKPLPDPQPEPTKPIETGKGDQAKKKKKTVKILSTKKHQTKYRYRLKANKIWFKDAHLQKSLGLTLKHKDIKWRLVKSERVRIHGKTYTYYQVRDRAGDVGWILKGYVVKVK